MSRKRWEKRFGNCMSNGAARVGHNSTLPRLSTSVERLVLPRAPTSRAMLKRQLRVGQEMLDLAEQLANGMSIGGVA